ncbi:lytic transglycosylase [Marinobacter salicampi]|uniref:lytic transglycosylase n=1 Tax=Marinobacter salicampi TaxID=435907 RepID=UPI001409C740|nr:LysM peptidoglycan-binding domain-containing protein [Marinobacter salicampi]
MTVRSITALLLLGLLSGCSSLGTGDSDPDSSKTGTTALSEEELLESENVTVAAGDEQLKRAVESGKPGRETDEPAGTRLDSAIEPTLKGKADDARKRLDSRETSVTDLDQPAQASDLWARLRTLYAMDHSVDNRRVQQQLEWYARHPQYIERVVKRGSRYLHHIVNEVEERGLPGELALLPIVESAFDPFAYSHGRAAGMWQFIPSTGKYFGLEQSWWHDQRRDILDSTDAALNYLERLSERFGGDYTLALAAYNSGGGTVSKAIRKNKNRGASTDYWNLNLPQETRAYVPKLLALAKIFDDPEAYGVVLPELEDVPYFETVEIGSQIDLAQAAELAAIDIEEVYLLNPSFNRWATSPSGPHRLLVPVASAERFKEGLASIDPKARVAWQDYKVVSGDSLIRIANKFGTKPDVIREVNNINGNLIRVGQQLLIPTARGGSEQYALSQPQRLAKKQASGGRSGKGTKVEHKTRSGDTFWDIAREHKVSVRQLASWNGMAPGDPLMPGKKLVIWSKAPTSYTASTGSARDKAMVRRVGYQVRRGDSLAAIANRFSVAVSDIASWNDLNTARYLQPGQSLVLYVDIRRSP